MNKTRIAFLCTLLLCGFAAWMMAGLQPPGGGAGTDTTAWHAGVTNDGTGAGVTNLNKMGSTRWEFNTISAYIDSKQAYQHGQGFLGIDTGHLLLGTEGAYAYRLYGPVAPFGQASTPAAAWSNGTFTVRNLYIVGNAATSGVALVLNANGTGLMRVTNTANALIPMTFASSGDVTLTDQGTQLVIGATAAGQTNSLSQVLTQGINAGNNPATNFTYLQVVGGLTNSGPVSLGLVATESIIRGTLITSNSGVGVVFSTTSGFLKDPDAVAALAVGVQTRAAYNTNGRTAIDWLNMYLADGVTTPRKKTLHWGNSELLHANGKRVMAWGAQYLSDTNSVLAVDWGVRNTLNTTGKRTIEWNSLYLSETNSIPIVDWRKQELYTQAGKRVANWNSLYLQDAAAYPAKRSLDWSARNLIAANGMRVVNWNSTYLSDTNRIITVDWAAKVLTNGWTVNIGTLTPTATVDAAGSTGDVRWDADYVYVKTGAGWKRSALTTW